MVWRCGRWGFGDWEGWVKVGILVCLWSRVGLMRYWVWLLWWRIILLMWWRGRVMGGGFCVFIVFLCCWLLWWWDFFFNFCYFKCCSFRLFDIVWICVSVNVISSFRVWWRIVVVIMGLWICWIRRCCIYCFRSLWGCFFFGIIRWSCGVIVSFGLMMGCVNCVIVVFVSVWRVNFLLCLGFWGM